MYPQLFIVFALVVSVTAHAQKKITPPLQHPAASLICQDRTIDVHGDCFQEDNDTPKLSCKKVQISFLDNKTHKVLASRNLHPESMKSPDDVIESEIGNIICTGTADLKKYVIMMMGTGGNCAECEWLEAYTWDGAYIGSSRDKEKNLKSLIDRIGEAAFAPKTKNVIGQMPLTKFYTPNETTTTKPK